MIYKLFRFRIRFVTSSNRDENEGSRVDLEAVEKAEKDLVRRENNPLGFIRNQIRMKCDIWVARSIEEIFKGCKIDYPKTEKGNPSFTKSFLENHPHKIPKVVEARVITRLRNFYQHD